MRRWSSSSSGCGWEPRFVEGSEPHEDAPADGRHPGLGHPGDQAHPGSTPAPRDDTTRPRWPMIVFRSPKGWTGPKEVDGNPVEGCFRAHQVPISMGPDTEKHLPILEQWLRSYHPEELFDEDGRPVNPLRSALAPKGDRRMGANPHANGGLLLRDLRTPDFRDYAVEVPAPGEVGGPGHAGAGRLRPGCDAAEPGSPELPHLRPGRDGRPTGSSRSLRSPAAASWGSGTRMMDTGRAPGHRTAG